MRKKITLYTMATIVFMLLSVTLVFISLINYQYEQNIKLKLEDNNKIISKFIDSNDSSKIGDFLSKEYNDSNVYITFIKKNNNVILFNSNKDFNESNKNSYYQIIKSESKNSHAIRYSNVLNKDMMYFINEDSKYIIISSQSLDFKDTLEMYYLKYYLLIMVIVFFISLCFAKKLSSIIIKPIKDLETIADMVDKGEFRKNIMINSDDELGTLGKKFNNMAQKLKLAMKDSLDKQNRMEAILKSMESGVIAVDRNHKVIMINPYAEMLFGVEEDIIGKNLIDSIRDFEIEDVFKSDFNDFKEVKILWPEERVIRIKTADIVNENKHIGKVAVFQDITDIIMLENMRSQFVANVSHELKTPLTSIKGFTETLKYVQDNEKRIKFLDIIDDEVERLTRLINDILTLSHIEAQKEMKQEMFSVNEVVNNVYNLMKNIAENKHIYLFIEKNDYVKLSGDKDRFKQMLINLVDNAVKYSEYDDKVYITSTIKENTNIIIVEDTGLGISKEHIKRLFERFYRVDKARSRAKGGTGLGLAIVKHIVLNFGGTIEVESKLGQGSKFIIRIPLSL